jgi:hypothetical protein
MAMTDLREELGAALGTVYPGEAPVEAAMRQGRRLRFRRRAAALAGGAAVMATVAALAALAAGHPALSQKPAAPASSVPAYQYITVSPGRGSPSGVIAAGSIGGTRWTVSVSDAFAGGCVSGTIGTDVVSGNCWPPGMLTPQHSGYPLFLQGGSDGDYIVMAGGVEADVRYVVVTLDNSQQLKLIPVRLGGNRYIAYAMPAMLQVTMVTAYLANEQVLTAIPYYSTGDGIPQLVRWVGPGLHPVQSGTEVVGSGRTGGRSWTVVAAIGAWGTCLQGYVTVDPPEVTGASCWPSTQVNTTQIDGTLGDEQGNDLQLVAGSAAPTVTEVKVTLTNGTSVRVPARTAGAEKFWALALGHGQSVRHWTAYDAAGKQVASGNGAS